jgi:hypothetical protein
MFFSSLFEVVWKDLLRKHGGRDEFWVITCAGLDQRAIDFERLVAGAVLRRSTPATAQTRALMRTRRPIRRRAGSGMPEM